MSALKASIRKQGVIVNDADLLMVKLGELDYVFKCYNNDEGAMEIIVPNNLAAKIRMEKYKKYTLEKYEIKKSQFIV